MGVLILGALLCQTVFFYTYALGDVENYKQADPLVTRRISNQSDIFYLSTPFYARYPTSLGVW